MCAVDSIFKYKFVFKHDGGTEEKAKGRIAVEFVYVK